MFNSSSACSPNSTSVTGASIPAAPPDAPAPGSSRSINSTESPRCVARHAEARPITPAPTTTTSYPVLRGASITDLSVSAAGRAIHPHARITRIGGNGRRRPSRPLSPVFRAPVRTECYSGLVAISGREILSPVVVLAGAAATLCGVGPHERVEQRQDQAEDADQHQDHADGLDVDAGDVGRDGVLEDRAN